MLTRASHLEHLFDQFADECVIASEEGELERPLELRRDLGRYGSNTILLVAQFLIVPDDYISTAFGRRPYQHDR